MKTLFVLALIAWLYCSMHPTLAARLVHLCPAHAAAAAGTHWDTMLA